MNDFRDKVAVVTGAASGIGRAMADRFASEGMKVVLADVEEKALLAAEREVAATGAQVVASLTDVSQAKAVDELASFALHKFGGVHIVCNNAGVSGSGGASWELPYSDWEWVLGVNLWGVIHGIRTFVPIMHRQGGEAHVVNTASMGGLVAGPMVAPYRASKFAVVSISETLYHELILFGSQVRVSVLCPSWVNTKLGMSHRNQPEVDGGDPTRRDDSPVLETMRQGMASGLSPARVANRVVNAIRSERLYVITHQERTTEIRQRADDIAEGRNPKPIAFG